MHTFVLLDLWLIPYGHMVEWSHISQRRNSDYKFYIKEQLPAYCKETKLKRRSRKWYDISISISSYSSIWHLSIHWSVNIFYGSTFRKFLVAVFPALSPYQLAKIPFRLHFPECHASGPPTRPHFTWQLEKRMPFIKSQLSVSPCNGDRV